MQCLEISELLVLVPRIPLFFLVVVPLTKYEVQVVPLNQFNTYTNIPSNPPDSKMFPQLSFKYTKLHTSPIEVLKRSCRPLRIKISLHPSALALCSSRDLETSRRLAYGRPPANPGNDSP